MAFKYFDIKNYKAQKNELFSFDANVWIYYHDQTNQKSYQRPYTRFLNQLLNQKEDPEVLLPAAVLSEVMNKLLKGKYCSQFLRSEEGKEAIASKQFKDDEVFKKVYRPHTRYIKDRNSIYSSIYYYSSRLHFICDEFDGIKLEDLTTAYSDLDFTDWLIYDLAKIHNATIISHDGDFKIENHPIVTNNEELLKMMK